MHDPCLPLCWHAFMTLSVARCLIGTWDSKAGQLAILAEVCNGFWEAGKGPVRPANVTPLLMAICSVSTVVAGVSTATYA